MTFVPFLMPDVATVRVDVMFAKSSSILSKTTVEWSTLSVLFIVSSPGLVIITEAI